jgi:hypothetical protein
MVSRAFPIAQYHMYELVDSAVRTWNHPSPALLPHASKWTSENCDLAIMFGGSILTEAGVPLMEAAANLEVPVALVGASCYKYNENDKQVAAWAGKAFDLVITRDEPTASFITDGNVVVGMDLAFWYVDSRAPYHAEYAVVNLDQGYSNQDMIRRREELIANGYPETYIVENTTRTPRNIPGYIHISYDWQLWNLYAFAKYVETCRIHTSIACVLSATPFRYQGNDQGGVTGRNTLFNLIGMTLRKKEVYKEKRNQWSHRCLAFREHHEKAMIQALRSLV